MSYIIYDLIILAVLIVFALWGRRKGLVLSLCSLVATLVAFVGALLLANLAAPAVANALEPRIATVIESRLEESAKENGYTGAVIQGEISLDGVLDALDKLEDLGLPESITGAIRDAAEKGAERLTGAIQGATEQSIREVLTDVARSIAAEIAKAVAFVVVFLVGFVLILVVWGILSHTLDLVTKLPILNTLNKAGGLVIGALRGAIFLFVCAWVIRHLGSSLISAEAVEKTYLMRFFMTVNPLELLAKV